MRNILEAIWNSKLQGFIKSSKHEALWISDVDNKHLGITLQNGETQIKKTESIR